jgi:hypothetical protein
MGGGVVLLHGFPVLYNGTENMALARGILDLEHWFGVVHKGRDIAGVRKHCINLTFGASIMQLSAGTACGSPTAPQSGQAVGSPTAPTMHPMRLMLPSFERPGARNCFESPGYRALPVQLEAISVTDEKNIFEMLTQVLNSEFMTELALEINTSRDNDVQEHGTGSALSGKRFVIIGASHATRLASAMEDAGALVVDIFVPGWRISAEAVEAMIGELSAILDEEYTGDTYIIYQLFDNNTYLSCDAAGARALPVKLEDNRYHVPGRLVFLDREGFKELFMIVLPLLRAGRNNTKIMLSPLMQYVNSSCCNNSSHLINRKERRLSTSMGEAIGEIKEWISDFAFTRRIRNFAVLCPNNLLQDGNNLEEAGKKIRGYWSAGPVHMNTEGYAALAVNLLNNTLEIKLSRPTEAAGAARGPAVIPDRAAMRQKWVTSNDSAVHRNYEDGDRAGGHRGQRGGRGGRIFRGGRGGRSRGSGKVYKTYQKFHRGNPY